MQVSEVDVRGRVLSTFADVKLPAYLALDAEGRLLVADCNNNRILLMNSQLQLKRMLVRAGSELELWKPKQLSFDELTSRLYVLHNSSSSRRLPWSDVVTRINLR